MNVLEIATAIKQEIEAKFQKHPRKLFVVAWGPPSSHFPTPGYRVVPALELHQRKYLQETWRWVGVYTVKVDISQIAEDIEFQMAEMKEVA